MKCCTDCKNCTFDMSFNDLICNLTNESCPTNLKCNNWVDSKEDTRCDNWREYNLSSKRHIRYKQLDKFCYYMKRKHKVWLLTNLADAHDIVGGHIGW